MNNTELTEKRIQIMREDQYIAESVSYDVHDLLIDMEENGSITIHPKCDKVELSIAVQKIVLNILRDLVESKQKMIQRMTRKNADVERNIDPDL